MRMWSRIVAISLGVFGISTAAMAAVEEVYIQQVLSSGDKAIVVRRNGDAYLIEHGVGCLSLWRFEGHRVVITSPGLFLGEGSILLIPQEKQECRIWNGEQIGTGYSWDGASTGSASGGSYRFVSPGAAAAEAIANALREERTANGSAPSSPGFVVQPEAARIYVEGGPKDVKNEVLALLRASTDMLPVPYIKKPEANINLQKDGTAKVKCGDANAVLPGPTASEIVQQFRSWLPAALARRRGPGGPPLP
jgi:hypothetical protein